MSFLLHSRVAFRCALSCRQLQYQQIANMSSIVDTIKTTLAENLTGPAHKAAGEPFTLDQVPDQTGKVAVITGELSPHAYDHSLMVI